jgi:hypothetical protein
MPSAVLPAEQDEIGASLAMRKRRGGSTVALD